MDEVFRSVYETTAQGQIYSLLGLGGWVSLGKLWGHEDVLDDRVQRIGSGNGHAVENKAADATVMVQRQRVQDHVGYARPRLRGLPLIYQTRESLVAP